VVVVASVVTILHEGKSYEVEVDGHESILEAAIDAGIENLSYDCKMVRREGREEAHK
jgi:ferredoxin